MQVASDQYCFVCGPDNPIGLKAAIRVDPDGRSAETRLVLADRYQGWQGVVHGGIISTLLDELAIYACRALSLHAVTTGLTVRFRRPVPTGSEVTVRAEVQSVRRKMADVRAHMTLDGETMAEADVRIMFMKMEKEVSK